MGCRQVRSNLQTMTKALSWLVLATCVACGAENQATDPEPARYARKTIRRPPEAAAAVAGSPSLQARTADRRAVLTPQVLRAAVVVVSRLPTPPLSTSRPRSELPGCGFAAAAFCDTFDGPAEGARARRRARPDVTGAPGGWRASFDDARDGHRDGRHPGCRAGVSGHVWPDDDTLVCDPTADSRATICSLRWPHRTTDRTGTASASPSTSPGRTGKIVFDATVMPLSPLHGWISLAITEDPISMPGLLDPAATTKGRSSPGTRSKCTS